VINVLKITSAKLAAAYITFFYSTNHAVNYSLGTLPRYFMPSEVMKNESDFTGCYTGVYLLKDFSLGSWACILLLNWLEAASDEHGEYL